MGVFALRCPDHPPVAVDASQLFVPVDKGYLEYHGVPIDQIRDKNKADSFTRAVTLVQISWFVIQCIARASEKLAFTSLELSTLEMIFCTINTMFFWMYKPLDVEASIVLPCPTLLRTIRADNNLESDDSHQISPLAILKKNTGISMVQPFCIAVEVCFDWRGNKEKQRSTVISDTLTIPPRGLKLGDILYGCFFTLAYLGIHLAGWNFTFPSSAEQLFWRVASLVLLGLVALYLIALAFGYYAAGWLARILFKTDGVETIADVAQLLPHWIGILLYLPIILAYSLARI